MNNPFIDPALFDSELHRQWKHERALRHSIPLDQAWRGCLGLAMLLARPDDTEYHGKLAFVRNEQLTWIALRDIPVDHFPGSVSMNRRDVQYANTVVAELRHGMPFVDFRRNLRDAVDFRFMPFAPYLRPFGSRPWDVGLVRPRGDTLDSQAQAREFAVLNRMSAAMTQYAFGATDAQGQPLRRQWANRRPADVMPFCPLHPTAWMPRPYLAFPLQAAEQLYWLSTETGAGDVAWECPNCGHSTDARMFRSSQVAQIEVLESGDFVATCVHCKHRRKWLLDDGRPSRVRRCFTRPFQEQFCRAVAWGVKATAIGPELYRGQVLQKCHEFHDNSRLELLQHRLQSQIDGTSREVFLPAAARIKAKAGQVLEASDVWAEASPPAPAEWRRRPLDFKWSSLRGPCGGPQMVGFLQRLWFEHQAVRLPSMPQQILFPADLVAPAVQALRPVGLWWDSAPTMRHYDWQLQAAGFPPIRLKGWDAFHLSLPGDVAVDASIADSRFSRERGAVQGWRASLAESVGLPLRTHAPARVGRAG